MRVVIHGKTPIRNIGILLGSLRPSTSQHQVLRLHANVLECLYGVIRQQASLPGKEIRKPPECYRTRVIKRDEKEMKRAGRSQPEVRNLSPETIA